MDIAQDHGNSSFLVHATSPRLVLYTCKFVLNHFYHLLYFFLTAARVTKNSVQFNNASIFASGSGLYEWKIATTQVLKMFKPGTFSLS